MKKILTIAAAAFVMASCGNKEEGICVDKFFENPVVGSEIVVSGKAKVCCCSGALLIAGCEKNAIAVAPAEGVAVPENVKDAVIKVKGIVSSETIDEQYVAKIAEEAAAAQDSTERAGLEAKAVKIMEAITANNGPIYKYTIAATSIEIVKGCCKEGKDGCKKDGCKKEGKGCCKKDSAKCEGAAKDTSTSISTTEGEVPPPPALTKEE